MSTNRRKTFDLKLLIQVSVFVFTAGILYAAINGHLVRKEIHPTYEDSAEKFIPRKELTPTIQKLTQNNNNQDSDITGNKTDIAVIRNKFENIEKTQQEIKDDMKTGFEEVKELIRNGG